MSDAQELPPQILDALKSIGIHQPSREDPLHRRLVSALWRTQYGSVGNQMVAMRFEFNWELQSAGPAFAKAKADYEHYLDRRMTELLAEPKMSVAKAQVLANGTDEAYRLKLQYLLAEQRERSMRKFLDTFSAALDNHRTDRADQRAADREHQQSGV